VITAPSLDPDLLKAFLAVADHLSFTAAARSLNRTQSAVSSQIKRLEADLGVELFERSTTSVAVSPAGDALVTYARRILALGDEAVQRLRQHDVRGRVRLGVMDDYGALVLPSQLKSFAHAYPGIEIVMETGLTAGMVGRLGRDFDLVIAMHQAGHGDGDLLCRERAMWAGPLTLDPRKLDVIPLALYPVGCLFRQWALRALDKAGRPWRLAFVSHSLAAVEAIASQGLAVTVVKSGIFPKSLVPFSRKQGLPPLPRADIRLHCARELSSASALLAAHIRERFSTRAVA
jgi:DNA-binding transcriptional LysR family regulator